MGLQEQYKLIGQLKAIKKRLDLICEKMGIEASPLIKTNKDKKENGDVFMPGSGLLEYSDEDKKETKQSRPI